MRQPPQLSLSSVCEPDSFLLALFRPVSGTLFPVWSVIISAFGVWRSSYAILSERLADIKKLRPSALEVGPNQLLIVGTALAPCIS